METEQWISKIGRLHEECLRDDAVDSSLILRERFNDLLDSIQSDYPKNESVQNIEPITERLTPATPAQIRLRCGELADALGYDLPSSNSEENDRFSIQVIQKQSSEQTVEQSVTVDQTAVLIDNLARSNDVKDDLTGLLEEFEEEIEKEESDGGVLRDILKSVYEKSPEVAANMAMIGLQKGILGILDLQ